MTLISLKEYAKRKGVDQRTARDKARRGTLPAVKIGRDWLIDEDAPYIDHRVKSGKYTDWRKKTKKGEKIGEE